MELKARLEYQGFSYDAVVCLFADAQSGREAAEKIAAKDAEIERLTETNRDLFAKDIIATSMERQHQATIKDRDGMIADLIKRAHKAEAQLAAAGEPWQEQAAEWYLKHYCSGISLDSFCGHVPPGQRAARAGYIYDEITHYLREQKPAPVKSLVPESDFTSSNREAGRFRPAPLNAPIEQPEPQSGTTPVQKKGYERPVVRLGRGE